MAYDEMRNNIVVTFDRDIKPKVGMYLENSSRMPDVIIESCVVDNCPHMRLSSKNMVIKNNILNLYSTDIYIDDLTGFWAESGPVDSVLICGNRFGTAVSNVLVKSRRPVGCNCIHKNIVVRDNAFDVDAAENFVDENNTFGEMMIELLKPDEEKVIPALL